jgi:hypothetical protein
MVFRAMQTRFLRSLNEEGEKNHHESLFFITFIHLLHSPSATNNVTPVGSFIYSFQINKNSLWGILLIMPTLGNIFFFMLSFHSTYLQLLLHNPHFSRTTKNVFTTTKSKATDIICCWFFLDVYSCTKSKSLQKTHLLTFSNQRV